MLNSEFPTSLKPLAYSTYLDNLSKRVREPEMDTASTYSFIAELTMSRFGEAAEFQARLAQIIPGKMGQAGLLLCLLDPETDDTMLFMNADSTDGKITPQGNQRITHYRDGNLGTVAGGYLLHSDSDLEPRHITEPESLNTHAAWSSGDTRTAALALEGIFLSTN